MAKDLNAEVSNMSHVLENMLDDVQKLADDMTRKKDFYDKEGHPNIDYLYQISNLLTVEAQVELEYKEFLANFKHLQDMKIAIMKHIDLLKSKIKSDYMKAKDALYEKETSVGTVALPPVKIGGISCQKRSVFKYPDDPYEIPAYVDLPVPGRKDVTQTFYTRTSVLDKKNIEKLLKAHPEYADKLHVYPDTKEIVSLRRDAILDFLNKYGVELSAKKGDNDDDGKPQI